MKLRLLIFLLITILFTAGCTSMSALHLATIDLTGEVSLVNDERNVEMQNKDGKAEKNSVSHSYVMDTSNDYVREGNDGRTTYTYKGKYESDQSWDLWIMDDDESNPMLIKEDENGLYTGYPESEYFIDVAYPLEKGKIFVDDFGGRLKITEDNLTVETEAGTFNDVVEVTTQEDWKIYYAPDIGHIRSIDEHNQTVQELIEIIPR